MPFLAISSLVYFQKFIKTYMELNFNGKVLNYIMILFFNFAFLFSFWAFESPLTFARFILTFTFTDVSVQYFILPCCVIYTFIDMRVILYFNLYFSRCIDSIFHYMFRYACRHIRIFCIGVI